MNPKEKLAKTTADMKAILDKAKADGNRDLTAEESAAFDALEKEANDLRNQIAAEDRRTGRMAAVEQLETELAAIRPAVARGSNITTPQGPGASRKFESLGEFLEAVSFNPNDSRLDFVQAHGATQKGTGARGEMRQDTGSSGGFAVPHEFRAELLMATPQAAIIRPRATVIPAGNVPDASLGMPALDQGSGSNMYGGVTLSWIGEGDEKPDTNAKLRDIQFTPHEVAGTITVTDKLLRNWSAAEMTLRKLLMGALTYAEERAFHIGNGTAKPLGFIPSNAAIKVNRQTANKVKYLDLVNMLAKSKRGPGTIWVINQGVESELMLMEDTEGRLIWQPSARDGVPATLLGYPVQLSPHAPALGTKGDISINDFSNYLIKDGFGPFVAASSHVKFTSNKTVLKIFSNVDAAPWLNAPLLDDDGVLRSPFVVLDVPA